jgi:membrane protein
MGDLIKPNAKRAPSWPWARYCRQLMQEDIWHHSNVFDKSLRGRLYAFLRVASITGRGILTKKMFSQAAALSYASLMSLGPIVSLAIMISTLVLRRNSEGFTTDLLNNIVKFIAPTTSMTAADAGQPNEQLVTLLNTFVESAHHWKGSVFSLLFLVFICIQMMISIENNFNNIWGVRRGRNTLRRIVLYWTVFILGVLAAFTTATVLSAATLHMVGSKLPWGLDIVGNFTGITHLLAFVLLTLLLAVFYRFIPNTKVRWVPALIGGLVVAICLILNNYFSFLYVATVLNKMNLYGSVGIIPILMFGLYVFWGLVLFGGVLTYAVQNANIITADRLWNQVSPRTKRLLNLAAFVQISRAFLQAKPGPTAEELANRLRVPAAILNEGLSRLTDLQLVSVVEAQNQKAETEKRYRPGQPLQQLTLGQFHHALDLVGNTDGDEYLKDSDSLVPLYLEAINQFERGSALHQTFAELLNGTATTPIKA